MASATVSAASSRGFAVVSGLQRPAIGVARLFMTRWSDPPRPEPRVHLRLPSPGDDEGTPSLWEPPVEDRCDLFPSGLSGSGTGGSVARVSLTRAHPDVPQHGS